MEEQKARDMLKKAYELEAKLAPSIASSEEMMKDDYIDKTTIEKCVNRLEIDNSDIALVNFRYCDEAVWK